MALKGQYRDKSYAIMQWNHPKPCIMKSLTLSSFSQYRGVGGMKWEWNIRQGHNFFCTFPLFLTSELLYPSVGLWDSSVLCMSNWLLVSWSLVSQRSFSSPALPTSFLSSPSLEMWSELGIQESLEEPCSSFIVLCDNLNCFDVARFKTSWIWLSITLFYDWLEDLGLENSES